MSEIGKVTLVGQTKVIGADYGDINNPNIAPNLRILGLELHYTNGYGQVEELGLIPLDVVDVGGLGPSLRGRLRVVVHTNAGSRVMDIQL